MTRTQTIGVLLIALGLLYAFAYAGLLRRAKRKAGAVAAVPASADDAPVSEGLPSSTEEDTDPGRVDGPAARVDDVRDDAALDDHRDEAEEAAALRDERPEEETEQSQAGPLPDVSSGLAGRYEGTRVGRERSPAKNLGKPGRGTMSVGPEGATWRPDDGPALRADPATIASARMEGEALVVLWHPDAATSHQTGFTPGSVADADALLDALANVAAVAVHPRPAEDTHPSNSHTVTRTIEMETP